MEISVSIVFRVQHVDILEENKKFKKKVFFF